MGECAVDLRDLRNSLEFTETKLLQLREQEEEEEDPAPGGGAAAGPGSGEGDALVPML